MRRSLWEGDMKRVTDGVMLEQSKLDIQFEECHNPPPLIASGGCCRWFQMKKPE